MKFGLMIATAGLFLTGACAREHFVGRPDLQVVEESVMPPPTREDLLLQQRSYLIGPQDKVIVDVYGVPELSKTIQVDASGTIALPLVGVIEASGKSTTELATLITDRLRARYVRDPQVTVSADTINQAITVDGEVEKPGQYPVNGRMTLMRAVASAEGTAQYADDTYVVVFRQVASQQMAALYDLRAIRQGMYADPEVYANDIVFVGESNGRRLFTTIIQAGALVTAPIVALIQR